MSDTCKIEASAIVRSNDVLKSKEEEQPADEPLMRFETNPPKKGKPPVLAPVPRTAPILVVQQPRLFTDQQMVAILIVFFAIVCFGILVHAMRS